MRVPIARVLSALCRTVGCNSDTAEEMVEEMCNIPNVSVRNQLKVSVHGASA